MMRKHGYIARYRQAQAVDAGADPHRLIGLLLTGVIERIGVASACIERWDNAGKHGAISAALEILDGLRLSLDHRAGGEIAAGLESIYDYAARRLVEANLHNDTGRLTEVAGLLVEIETAWLAIPERLVSGTEAGHGAGS